ncbi:unnamed protein product [Effrenium voratum]|nr:unnamed protein product [Effrenium voratum]
MDNVVCPLGEGGALFGKQLTCELQTALLAAVLMVPICCCCTRLLRCKREGPKQLRGGELPCGELGAQSYTVSLPGERKRAATSTLLDQAKAKPRERDREVQGAAATETAVNENVERAERVERVERTNTSCTNATQESAPPISRRSSWASIISRITKPAKVHVVWKVDMQQVQDWLAGRTSAPEWQDPENERSGRSQQETETQETAPETAPETEKGGEPALARVRKDSFPAYTTGDRVEYFSATKGLWLLGEVRTAKAGKTPFVYSVTLHRLAQELPHIDPEMLRRPFQPGEPCELWSLLRQRWLAAEVLCMEAGSTPIRHYKVCAAGADPVVVQASYLRRCFPEGSRVQVYEGPTRGFSYGRVAGPATVSPCREVGMQAQKVGKSEGPVKADGSRLDYNVMVPVLKDSQDQSETELVPSFNLRLEQER